MILLDLDNIEYLSIYVLLYILNLTEQKHSFYYTDRSTFDKKQTNIIITESGLICLHNQQKTRGNIYFYLSDWDVRVGHKLGHISPKWDNKY